MTNPQLLFRPLPYNILGVKNGTRNLSDKEFDRLLPDLAQEISQLDYRIIHDHGQLSKDWYSLQKANVYGNEIHSTSRIGMKLCEHFFPNFWDIRSMGKSFAESWKDPSVMEKVLEWNRKSHSTPYLSELRRGVYFVQGMTKSTMYRPLLAKAIVKHYRAKRVLDPCAGWGGRMLGTVAAGAEYYAFEPNVETVSNLYSLAYYLGIDKHVHIYCDDALQMDEYDFPKVNMILTSPPYFDLEIYDDGPKQSVQRFPSYKEWVRGFIRPLIDKGIDRLCSGGVSCWNVAKVRSRHDLVDEVEGCHSFRGMKPDETFSVVSSKRQANQTVTKNMKSSDDTVCYRYI